MWKKSPFWLLLLLLVACRHSSIQSADSKLPPRRFELSNGWGLSPVGKQLVLGDLPLQLVLSSDGRRGVVSNNGQSSHSLQWLDLEKDSVLHTLEVPKAWYGLALNAQGNTLYASGGNDNNVRQYQIIEDKLVLQDSIALGAAWPKAAIWTAGLCLDEATQTLYALGKDSKTLYVLDLGQQRVSQQIDLGAQPYTCLLSQNRQQVFISLWGGKAIAIYNIAQQKILAQIPTGLHPTEMLQSRDGQRLFVACADDNTVEVIDLRSQTVQETLVAAPYPNAPTGSAPNSLALSSDGQRLYVANADNNCLVVFKVAEPGKAEAEGFIPTGWYPTSVRVRGNTIFVANGKGSLGSFANPQGPQPADEGHGGGQYIGGLFKGSLSIITRPTAAELMQYSRWVYQNTPYTKALEAKAKGEAGNPIPRVVGQSSPIQYVFYIIRENRTYDQVFGDIKRGNGDPRLCLFPDSVTPNAHKLAQEYVLLDNFYVNAEVSADGHSWSMGAYANDYLEKTWPTNYGGKGGSYDYEGQNPSAVPKMGFIWDHCLRHKISFRNYGEMGYGYNPPIPATLRPYTCRQYPAWDLNIKDSLRYKRWKVDFDSLLRQGALPRLSIIGLGGDHTSGAAPGARTPAAMVADNDWALGKIIEHISHSPIWKSAAVFVLEDDAQNGPDHVDAHRSVALIASPYTKRQHYERSLYSTASMVRTIELILGLPPMSQYDAAATPLYACFSKKPNMQPYTAVPYRINLNQLNPNRGKLSQLSRNLPLQKVDQVPDLWFSQIIWKAVRGEHAVMPAPRRGAFIRPEAEEEE
jgi:DNA-binding beta-propeller fold protein YncE